MLQQHEVRFEQAEIELISDALHGYGEIYAGARTMIDDLQLRLNTTLTCEEDMCKNKRFAMTSFCADHPQEERQVA